MATRDSHGYKGNAPTQSYLGIDRKYKPLRAKINVVDIIISIIVDIIQPIV